jgi:hypothetical protein
MPHLINMTKKLESMEQELTGANFALDTSGCSIECIHDIIRKRAYQLFELRGRQSGHELSDWLDAEREIKHHFSR